MTGKKRPFTFADDAEAQEPPPAAPPLASDELWVQTQPQQQPQPDDVTFAMPPAPRSEGEMQLSQIGDPHGRARDTADTGRGVYWLAALASALWLGGMLGAVLAYQNRLGYFDYDAFAFGVFGLLAIAPLGLIWLSIYAVRQGRAFIAEARRSQDYAERMVEPAALAAAEAGSVMESIRGQIELATATAAQARAEMVHLRDVLAEETDRLVESANLSTQSARALVDSLGRERQELSNLTGSMDGQAAAIAESITRQARMVAEASDLAQTQIAEAEAALAARAADLSAAAGQAGDAARLAGEDLARQAVRLETTTSAIADQIQIAEDTLGQQRAALVTTAHDLRADTEDMSVQVEMQRAQLAEILLESGESAMRLGDVAAEGAKALRDLSAEAAEQFREVAETAQSERDLLGATALQSLGAFSEAAAFERRALEEQTHRAIDALQQAADEVHRNAEISGEAARIKVEQLSEAAFEAGQKADSVFETRMDEARALIERTAALVDEAGAKSVQRLGSGINDARTALAELERSMEAIEGRAARLPEDAQARADEVKQALETATATLLDTARKAAEETQAIDAAFQERVKRNYEMLSEAVRLMGVIGGGASARASGLSRPAPPPRTPPEPALRPTPDPQRAADPGDAARTRLRLTPPAPAAGADPEAAMFEASPAPSFSPSPSASPSPSQGEDPDDEWTWKDLLGAVDSGDAPDDDSLADVLIREIENLALDPAALLPRARIDEVLNALNSGNPTAARDSVRRLAPAAIRRLSRRVLSDKILRAQTERFTMSYRSLLREAMRPGAEVTPHNLLSSDAGRAFLLLDAAVGDLA